MTALNELLSRAADPARKHAAGSPAKGRWLTITATPALIEKVKAEDRALRELAKRPKRPKLPASVKRGLLEITCEMACVADTKASEDAQGRRTANDIYAALEWLERTTP